MFLYWRFHTLYLAQYLFTIHPQTLNIQEPIQPQNKLRLTVDLFISTVQDCNYIFSFLFKSFWTLAKIHSLLYPASTDYNAVVKPTTKGCFTNHLSVYFRYWQQGTQAFQGTVLDAQHWLRFSQEDPTHAPQRLPQGKRYKIYRFLNHSESVNSPSLANKNRIIVFCLMCLRATVKGIYGDIDVEVISLRLWP